jgi:hypothetical protein
MFCDSPVPPVVAGRRSCGTAALRCCRTAVVLYYRPPEPPSIERAPVGPYCGVAVLLYCGGAVLPAPGTVEHCVPVEPYCGTAMVLYCGATGPRHRPTLRAGQALLRYCFLHRASVSPVVAERRSCGDAVLPYCCATGPRRHRALRAGRALLRCCGPAVLRWCCTTGSRHRRALRAGRALLRNCGGAVLRYCFLRRAPVSPVMAGRRSCGSYSTGVSGGPAVDLCGYVRKSSNAFDECLLQRR